MSRARIFLDFDGVLRPSENKASLSLSETEAEELILAKLGRTLPTIDPHAAASVLLDWDVSCVYWLRMLCEITGAGIVVLSSMRKGVSEQDIRALLAFHHLDVWFVCSAPHHEQGKASEIAEYMQSNDKDAPFVVIDDDPDEELVEKWPGCLVVPDSWLGLQESEGYSALMKLTCDDKYTSLEQRRNLYLIAFYYLIRPKAIAEYIANDHSPVIKVRLLRMLCSSHREKLSDTLIHAYLDALCAEFQSVLKLPTKSHVRAFLELDNCILMEQGLFQNPVFQLGGFLPEGPVPDFVTYGLAHSLAHSWNEWNVFDFTAGGEPLIHRFGKAAADTWLSSLERLMGCLSDLDHYATIASDTTSEVRSEATSLMVRLNELIITFTGIPMYDLSDNTPLAAMPLAEQSLLRLPQDYLRGVPLSHIHLALGLHFIQSWQGNYRNQYCIHSYIDLIYSALVLYTLDDYFLCRIHDLTKPSELIYFWIDHYFQKLADVAVAIDKNTLPKEEGYAAIYSILDTMCEETLEWVQLHASFPTKYDDIDDFVFEQFYRHGIVLPPFIKDHYEWYEEKYFPEIKQLEFKFGKNKNKRRRIRFILSDEAQ